MPSKSKLWLYAIVDSPSSTTTQDGEINVLLPEIRVWSKPSACFVCALRALRLRVCFFVD